MHQKTLRDSCEIRGVGLHSGKPARVVIHPAPANHGVVFLVRRRKGNVEIPAHARYVTRTKLSTCLGRTRRQICTVEHLMSAVFGLELDNLLIEVHGNEVPVVDGSAYPFVQAMRAAGYTVQNALKRYLRVLHPIMVQGETRSAALYPADTPSFAFTIEFPHRAIRVQERTVRLTPRTYVNEVARARTFGFESDLHALQEQSLAQGVSLENCVGLGSDGSVLNPDGLRYPDEFVRHKILDAIGDLSLAGCPILGEYRGVKCGHALNLKLVQTLLEHPERWELVESEPAVSAQAV